MSWLENVSRRYMRGISQVRTIIDAAPKDQNVDIPQRRAAYIAASEEVDRYTAWLTDNGPENYLDYSHKRHKELDEARQ